MTKGVLTWEQIETAAIGWSDDPKKLNVTASLFNQAVTLVRRGDLTEHEALIGLALRLAQMAQDNFDQLVEWRDLQPQSPFVIPQR